MKQGLEHRRPRLERRAASALVVAAALTSWAACAGGEGSRPPPGSDTRPGDEIPDGAGGAADQRAAADAGGPADGPDSTADLAAVAEAAADHPTDHRPDGGRSGDAGGPPPPDGGTPGADGPPGTRELCGGASRLTFTYVRVAALARHAPGSQVIWENGTTFLFIDGQCRYWVFGSSRGVNETDETRAGMLGAADARRLAQELKYAEWPALQGDYKGTLHDSTPDVFTDGTNFISCHAKCSFEGPPPAVRALYSAIDPWLDRLGASGQPMTGPVRVAIVPLEESYPDWPHRFAEWPLSDAMAGFVIPYGVARPGTSRRVAPPGAAQLRELRARARMRAFNPVGTGSFIPVRDGNGPLHGMYVRDALPFENDQGLVGR